MLIVQQSHTTEDELLQGELLNGVVIMKKLNISIIATCLLFSWTLFEKLRPGGSFAGPALICSFGALSVVFNILFLIDAVRSETLVFKFRLPTTIVMTAVAGFLIFIGVRLYIQSKDMTDAPIVIIPSILIIFGCTFLSATMTEYVLR